MEIADHRFQKMEIAKRLCLDPDQVTDEQIINYLLRLQRQHLLLSEMQAEEDRSASRTRSARENPQYFHTWRRPGNRYVPPPKRYIK